jgi:hypothetical protein
MQKYTRNEWGRCKNTLETSGEDAKIHSKRVENSVFGMAKLGAIVTAVNLGQMGSSVSVRSFARYDFLPRFECSFSSSPLVSSVVFHLPHSFRVYFSAWVPQSPPIPWLDWVQASPFWTASVLAVVLA